MGLTSEDVITSAPSVYGAACAMGAASLYWPAAILVPILGGVVSDPAQIWHLGTRCRHVADRIRAASDEMTAAVKSCADDFHWKEKGKKAFLETRLWPYQDALDEAADNFDSLANTLSLTAVGYTGLGLLSAAVGAAALTTVTSGALAGVVAPEITLAVNGRLAQIMKVIVSALRRLATWNGKLAKAMIEVLKRQEVLTRGAGRAVKLGTGGVLAVSEVGSLAVGGIAASTMKDDVDDVRWPERLAAGAAVPKGYKAATADQKNALRQIRHESIVELGKRLDSTAGVTLDAACREAADLHAGQPGFGACGQPIASAFKTARDGAVEQLTEARDTPGTWLPGLRTTAGNWVTAEDHSIIKIRREF
ncbi:hypothetical protein NE235_02200 [Actinoallomurus spadix]|uniref:Uncharacterized protein n=1 Tax=Actinoallomurus spadix TaxID=79912 RepID=A0ABP3HB85_9ACTN|nr:hypothetical protein [Actinoallomurus spadix]MCO5984915.1 hypothetical protein [Actinoallomurus spadix]